MGARDDGGQISLADRYGYKIACYHPKSLFQASRCYFSRIGFVGVWAIYGIMDGWRDRKGEEGVF